MKRRIIRWPGTRRHGSQAGAGEIGQSVKYPEKYVLCQPNDWSLDPRIHVKG